MPLLGHLGELRLRLLISFGTLIVATLLMLFFARRAVELMIRPVTHIFDPGRLMAPEPERLRLEVAPDGTLRLANPRLLVQSEPEDLRGVFDQALLVLTAADGSATTLSLGGSVAGRESKIVYASPIDPLMIQIKVAVILGILVSLVVWVWQAWLFVAPGLTPKEKRVVRPMLVGAVFLFPVGALFAYGMVWLVIPVMNRYVVSGIDTLYNVSIYLKLMTTMMIVFGLIFELPLVVAVLARVGIVTPAFLRHYRRHIYVGLAVLAMLMTPADVVSMLMALVPLIGLFEISIWVAGPMALMRAHDETTGSAASSGGTA